MIKRLINLVIIVLVLVGGIVLWQSLGNRGAVKLYFATKDGMNLSVEHRKVTGDKMRTAIEELIAGPKDSGLSPTIPDEVEVLSIRVSDGICTVNFNEKLAKNHWGGSSGEMLTVYSIVNTLAQFPGVEQVQILIEGQKVETLSGHLVLDESLAPDEELVRANN